MGTKGRRNVKKPKKERLLAIRGHILAIRGHTWWSRLCDGGIGQQFSQFL